MSTVVDDKDTVKEVPVEEETQDQSAAFDPETGEINWDCPCLGGMADGPCGEEFKAAFSCFVYSDAEPKGIDCVEKFKGMQDCFRRYPEVYAKELEDDEEEEEKKDVEETVVASSPFEEEPGSSNSFTLWISSWLS